MSDWFDNTNAPQEPEQPQTPAAGDIPPVPETPAVPEVTEAAPPTEPVAEPAAPSAPEAPVAAEAPKSETVTPPPAQSSWTAPADNGCTYHYANPYRQPTQNPYTGSAWQANPTPTPPQAPNPAPNPYGGWSAQPAPPPKPRKKVKGTTVVLSILSVVCALALIACAVLTVQLMTDKTPSTSEPATSALPGGDVSQGETSSTVNESAPTLEIEDPETLDGGLTNNAIIKKNRVSTVMIDIYTYTTSLGGFNQWGGYGGQNGQQLEKSGGATGIVWTADGYIITNCHCVVNEETGEPYPRVDVTMDDGTVYENATLIGHDATSDLAVIKVDATGLTPAEFGDSSKVEMGDRVVALGNPGSLGLTSSVGTISGLARDIYDDAGYSIKCLQTDAAINPGNSGGPLVNAYGQVIGINSAKIVAEGYEGLGFSIPINEAKAILDDLVKYSYVTGRVSLGITGYSVTTVGLEGFQIASIEKGSALENTDAQVGDIIAYVDGTRVTDYSSLRAALAAHKVGDTVTLKLLRYERSTRDVRTVTVTCTLGENRG